MKVEYMIDKVIFFCLIDHIPIIITENLMIATVKWYVNQPIIIVCKLLMALERRPWLISRQRLLPRQENNSNCSLSFCLKWLDHCHYNNTIFCFLCRDDRMLLSHSAVCQIMYRNPGNNICNTWRMSPLKI